ncbi:MAG: c-type cytochrome [Anaerolineae bacterium]|nr:c-type cytochrome [Anaerolineae bacterium]
MNQPWPSSAGARLRRSFIILLATAAALALLLAIPAPGAAQEGTAPGTVPDGDTGLVLFAERCANCHGPLGSGDGELTGDLPVQPAALNDVEFARQQVPAAVFTTITEGIAASGMPPFGPASTNPIGESDRWHLVAAVLSLGAPAAVVADGEAIYAESCAACHGEEGSSTFDMAAQAYWINRSDADVFAALRDTETILEHDAYSLEDEALWATVAYARTISYDYADPLAAFAPIEAVRVTGIVENATTGTVLPERTEVVLNTFTADFAPSTTMTTTVDAAGEYGFNLTMMPPDLIYVVTVTYEGINYGSDFGRVERDEPILNLPVTVYDPTSDPAGIRIDQLHIILEFVDGTVNVNELYQFSQDEPAVFVGESGAVADGTVEITLPDGATTPSFSRTFGSMDSFFAVENIVQTEERWADTVPVRPGEATLSLLASYSLPYDGSATIAHPVYYDVDRVNVVLAASGVTLSGDEGWSEEAGGAMGGLFASYRRTGMAAGESVRFTLAGDPVPVTMPGSADPAGAATAPVARDRTTELVIGGGVLLLALVAGFFIIRSWQQREPYAGETADVEPLDRDTLLEELAALDDAFEAGEIDEETYQFERAALKEVLLAIWE